MIGRMKVLLSKPLMVVLRPSFSGRFG